MGQSGPLKLLVSNFCIIWLLWPRLRLGFGSRGFGAARSAQDQLAGPSFPASKLDPGLSLASRCTYVHRALACSPPPQSSLAPGPCPMEELESKVSLVITRSMAEAKRRPNQFTLVHRTVLPRDAAEGALGPGIYF